MTDAASDRPIRGFDTFLAVLIVLVVNFGIGAVVGVVFAVVWLAAKMPGNPAEFLVNNFYAVLGLTAALNAVTLVGLYFVGRRMSRRPFGYFYAPVPVATIAKAAASAVLMMALFYALEFALLHGWHIVLNPAKTEQAMTPKNWTELWVVLALGAVFIPYYEELLFRGYLFGWFKRVMPLWLAMVVSAAIFALVHGLFLTRGGISGWVGTGEIFALGLLLAWWAARTNSLWPAFTVHLVNNAGVFLMAFLLPNFP